VKRFILLLIVVFNFGCASKEPINQCEYVKGKIFCEKGTDPSLDELNYWRKK
jgi:hypothetical protein